MHRQHLLDLIGRYDARFPDEAETVKQFRRFVAEQPDCFQRHLAMGHVTGSAWLVDRDGGRAMFTHHRKLNIWIQLGGHADGDSDVARVALREAEEESGLDQIQIITPEIFDLDIHTIPARAQEPEHLHFDVRFAFRHTGAGNYAVSDESHDLEWIPLESITAYTQETSILRMVRKWGELAETIR